MSDNEKMQRLPLIIKSLHTEFKKCCVEKNSSMQSAAEEAISDWIKKKKNEGKSQ